MKKPWLVMTAITSVIVIVLLLCCIVSSFTYPKIYQGVTVGGMDLSGHSREEVAILLKKWQEEHRNKSIMLYFGEMTYELAATSIDLDVDTSAALDIAWGYGRDGSWWERIKKIWAAKKNGYDISLNTNYNEMKLDHVIVQWKSQIERPARNATFSMITGGIIPDQKGYRLESDTLRSLVVESFVKSENIMLTLPVTILEPEVTATDLANTGIQQALSVYTTIFNSQDVNRVANIKLAAGKANGHIIYPGDIFSFNDIVGPREKSYGFKEAIEIVNGEFVPGIGGGICQLSSTLYNAVILANLDIVERYNHSKALSYVPLGRDATVVFGSLDFKFVNNTLGPVMIMAEVSGNELMVGVLGKHSIAEKVEIVAMNQEKIQPAIIKQLDDSLYVGETKLEKQGTPGSALTIIRVVRSKGQVVKREILSKDHYPAEDTRIKVGTKIPPFADKIQ